MTIGERLREERLKRGLAIEKVAEQTRINPSLLEAIETENFDRLPGGFFIRSFVRQYARALGLSEAEFDAELNAVVTRAHEPAPAAGFRPEVGSPLADQRERFRPGARQSLGSLIALLLIIAVCSAIYAWWQRSRQAQTASVPAQTVHVVERPAPAQPPANAPPTGNTTPPPPPTAPPEAASPAEAAPAEAAQEAPVRVDIRAAEPVWIRVTKGGKFEYEGTLAAGESRSFTGADPITMRIGRPGSAEVTWNGKPTGALEPATSPITLEFTPETFRIVRAPPL